MNLHIFACSICAQCYEFSKNLQKRFTCDCLAKIISLAVFKCHSRGLPRTLNRRKNAANRGNKSEIKRGCKKRCVVLISFLVFQLQDHFAEVQLKESAVVSKNDALCMVSSQCWILREECCL